MKTSNSIFYLSILVLAFYSQKSIAQEDYRFEIGGGIGMTGYLGDANTSNLWSNPGIDGEILFRYLINPRIALKTNFYVAQLRGNTKNMIDVLPLEQEISFATITYELGEMFEFNFFNFGIGETYRKLQKWTPYITAGIGVNIWKSGGPVNAAFNIPMGVGFKFKANKRLNLGLEFLMKKTFCDNLDSPELSDPYGIKSSFMKNTDWYSTMTLTVSYEFGLRCSTCHYKE